MMTKKLLSIVKGIYERSFPFIFSDKNGIWSSKIPDDLLILSGSFNPLHEGHITMMKVAEEITLMNPVYEISVLNVDKPALPLENLIKRLKSFPFDAQILITSSPRFNDKSILFPGSKFLIGYDTAVRLLNSKYYSDFSDFNKGDIVLDALEVINQNNCSFIVAGRIDNTNRFKSIGDLKISNFFQHIFSEIPEEKFRLDISSTEIRYYKQ